MTASCVSAMVVSSLLGGWLPVNPATAAGAVSITSEVIAGPRRTGQPGDHDHHRAGRRAGAALAAAPGALAAGRVAGRGAVRPAPELHRDRARHAKPRHD